MVTPGTPDVLHFSPVDQPANRLEFARWIVCAENPLTSRVVVSHWATFFGRGIVETVDDLLIAGIASGSLRNFWIGLRLHLCRTMHGRSSHCIGGLSALLTYRQASVYRHDAAVSDPQNRLLTYMPRLRLRRRLFVTLCWLRFRGSFTEKRRLPVMPLQPAGITEVAFGSPNGSQWRRRSLSTKYLHHDQRTAPFAMVTTFDGPGGESGIAQRDRSNTPAGTDIDE
ncbi:MAG: DUF1553 domain-containing protein [Planctomycetaceae bacterium]